MRFVLSTNITTLGKASCECKQAHQPHIGQHIHPLVIGCLDWDVHRNVGANMGWKTHL